MILSKVKLYGGIFVTALIGVLYALLRIEKSEKKVAEQKAETYKAASETNEKVIEQVKKDEEVKTSVTKLSNDDVLSELQQYDRNRNKDSM